MGEHMRLIRIDFPEQIEVIPTVKYIKVGSFDEIKNKLTSSFGNKIFVFDLSGASLVDLTLLKHNGIIQKDQVDRIMKSYKIKVAERLDLTTNWLFEGYYDIPNLKKTLASRLIDEANDLLTRF